MKTLIKLEEAAQLCLALVLFNQLPFAWWWFPALILLPDLSMLGYLVNPRVGAYAYNVFHHKAVAIAIGVLGIFLGSQVLMLAGIMLFGHSAMDRLFGYGLKYTDEFANTHLGRIGQKAVRPTVEALRSDTHRVSPPSIS